MATKAEISFVKSLHLKKFRDEHLKFVVEVLPLTEIKSIKHKAPPV
jgi:hypothetical protein